MTDKDIDKDGLIIMRNETGYDGLLALIQYLQSCRDISQDTMVEIGAYKGESTVIFAQYFKKVIIIEPFIENYDEKDITCKVGKFDLVYSAFQENIKDYSNIWHIQDTSDEAIFDLINEPNISFVYVDGCHMYDQVVKDLENYIPLIVEKGFIGGHDYFEEHWPGVRRAIHLIVGIPDCCFVDSSWLKRKV